MVGQQEGEREQQDISWKSVCMCCLLAVLADITRQNVGKGHFHSLAANVSAETGRLSLFDTRRYCVLTVAPSQFPISYLIVFRLASLQSLGRSLREKKKREKKRVSKSLLVLPVHRTTPSGSLGRRSKSAPHPNVPMQKKNKH